MPPVFTSASDQTASPQRLWKCAQSESTSKAESFHRHSRIRTWTVLAMLTFVSLIATFAGGCRVTHTWCGGDVASMTVKQDLPQSQTGTRREIVLPFISPEEQGKIPEANPDGLIEPLTLREAESLAARNAPTARILDAESNGSSPCNCSDIDPQIQQAINQAINANINYQRNLTAEKALLAYLGLTEVYLQTNLADNTRSEIENLQSVLKQLQSENLLREVDPETLVRQQLSGAIQESDLVFNHRDLNQKLRLLLGLNDSSTPIWTSCQIEQWNMPIDLENEIRLATENRQDIQSIRGFVETGNDQLLDLLQSAIRTVSPLAAFRLRRFRLFGGLFRDDSAEIQKVRTQLAILHESQLELLQSEVRTQFHAIQKQHRQVQIYQQRLESYRNSEARLEVQRKVGPIKIEDVLEVKSGILKTRSQLIHAAVQLQMEWIKLRARQGLLGSAAFTDFDTSENGPAENLNPTNVRPSRSPKPSKISLEEILRPTRSGNPPLRPSGR